MLFIKLTKVMYRLPQAVLLANDLLEKHLRQHGYFQGMLVPGLWRHKTQPILFTLIVDDFGSRMSARNMRIISNVCLKNTTR
ncbi:hypothetical protein ACHAW6_002326 [Cyclotella cf. meneghiniana]